MTRVIDWRWWGAAFLQSLGSGQWGWVPHTAWPVSRKPVIVAADWEIADRGMGLECEPCYCVSQDSKHHSRSLDYKLSMLLYDPARLPLASRAQVAEIWPMRARHPGPGPAVPFSVRDRGPGAGDSFSRAGGGGTGAWERPESVLEPSRHQREQSGETEQRVTWPLACCPSLCPHQWCPVCPQALNGQGYHHRLVTTLCENKRETDPLFVAQCR